jgi:hypothetical protein
MSSDGADSLFCCPLWSEVCALRKYKAEADAHISRLERQVARDSDSARRGRELPSKSSPAPNYRRSLQQLWAIEFELQRLTSENAKLKSKLRRARQDVAEWQIFAQSTADQFRAEVNFSDPFPEGDADQRRVLSDLFAKALAPRQIDIAKHPEYRRLAQECSDVKEQLREVTQKCDRLHEIVRARSHRDEVDARPLRNAQALHSLGQHVKDLNRLTSRMKWDCKREESRRQLGLMMS